MNNNNHTAAVNAVSATVSEYHIGHTFYTVKTVFNPASKVSLSDILKRLIIRECEDFLGESGQEPEKQAV
ncbi:MAG: transposon-encoded TnpW family protein [Ruminococcus sp.]|nr:transposon-encoded TnpW family protein [Ruminococcus sp.]